MLALSFHFCMIFLLNNVISGYREEVRRFWFDGFEFVTFIEFLHATFIFCLNHLSICPLPRKETYFWTPTLFKAYLFIFFGSQCAVIIWIPCQLSSLHCIIKTSWENHGTWSSSWWASFTWLSGAYEFLQLRLLPAKLEHGVLLLVINQDKFYWIQFWLVLFFSSFL